MNIHICSQRNVPKILNVLKVKKRMNVSKRCVSGLTHIDNITNSPKMVDVSAKFATLRTAHAQATMLLPPTLLAMLQKQPIGDHNEIHSAKGPVFSTAVIAGVMASKKTSDLIPFCHPVSLEDCAITIRVEEAHAHNLVIDCRTRTTHKTGVEMEALVGATHAALCVYDMLKAVSHDIAIVRVQLMEKTGGKSHFKREEH